MWAAHIRDDTRSGRWTRRGTAPHTGYCRVSGAGVTRTTSLQATPSMERTCTHARMHPPRCTHTHTRQHHTHISLTIHYKFIFIIFIIKSRRFACKQDDNMNGTGHLQQPGSKFPFFFTTIITMDFETIHTK